MCVRTTYQIPRIHNRKRIGVWINGFVVGSSPPQQPLQQRLQLPQAHQALMVRVGVMAGLRSGPRAQVS